MSDEIPIQVDAKGADGVDRIVTSIDRLHAALTSLGNSGSDLKRLESAMQLMQASMTTGFAEMSALAQNNSTRMAAERAKGLEKLEKQQLAWEARQHANANKFHDRSVEIDVAAENKRARTLQAIIEKRDADEYATRAAAEQRQKALVERREVEEYAIRSAASARLQTLVEKRDTEEYAMRSAASARLQTLVEKRDLEEYTARAAAAAKLRALTEKRDAEEYASRAAASAKLQGLVEKRDMEEYTARGAAAAKMKAAVEQQQAELYAIRASAQEKQRVLDTAFYTSSLAQQIATAEKAKVYASLGGNATVTYGGAAAGADLARLRAQHEALAESIRRTTTNTNSHNDAMREAHGLARGLAGSLGGLWLTYGSMVPLLAGAAIAASLKNIVEVGKDVEYQLKFVEALGGTSVDLNKFLNITDQTVVSIKDAAGGMRALAQNGLDATDSLRVLPSVLNLATIGELSVEQAALSATGAMSAFGLQLGDIGRVGDIFAQTAASSNTSVAAMTESMRQASTVAGIYGSTIEETAAALGVLAKVNIIGSAAGTAYTNMLTNLYTPTEKAKKALAELNITTDDGAGGLKNSTQLIKELKDALSSYNETAKASYLGDIFTVRGQKGIATILNNYDSYIDKIEEAKNATGFMSAAVAKLEDSTEGASKHLKNAFGASLTEAFASSSPALQEMLMGLAHIARSESTVAMLTAIADATLRLTKFFVEHADTILLVAGAYTALRVLAAVPAMLAAVNVAVNTLTISATSLMRLLGWLGIAVTAATVVWQLFIDTTTDVEKADTRIRNSIQTNIEYLERETEALRKRNEERGVAPVEVPKSVQLVSDLEARVATAQQALDAKSKGFGPSSVTKEYETLAKLQKDLADAKTQQWKETALAEDLAVGLSTERMQKEKDGTLAAIDRLVQKGKVEKTVAGELIAIDAQGNEKSRAIALSAEEIGKQLRAGTLSQKQAAVELLAVERQYQGALSARAAKPDIKGENDALRAAINLNAEAKKLFDVRQKTKLLELTQKRETGDVGDLGYLTEKAKLDKAAVQSTIDEAKANISLVDGVKNKAAATQKYQTQIIVGAEQVKQIDMQLEIDKTRVFKQQADEQLRYQQKTLQDQGQNTAAFLMGYEAQYGTMIKKLQSDLATGNETTRASAQRSLDYLEALGKSGVMDNVSKDLQASFNATMSTLTTGIADLASRSKEGGLASMFDNALEAERMWAAGMNEALAKQRALQELANKPGADPKDQKAASDSLKKINDEADKVRGIWVSVGEAIGKSLTEAFGAGGTAVGGLISAFVQYGSARKKIESDIQKSQDNPEERAKAAKASASLQINTYGNMASAAKSFFKEGTKGYDALSKAEKIFRVAELAMSAQSMAQKLFETTTVTGAKLVANTLETTGAVTTTGVVVAAEGAKSTAYGVTALAAALAAPFPANIPAFAMVAAMLAAIGVVVSGSGGAGASTSETRQATTGVGSILGDSNLNSKNGPFGAKSESIAKSLSMVEGNTYRDMQISSGMLASLRNIEGGIGRLGALVARTDGSGLAAGQVSTGSSNLGGSLGSAAAMGVGAYGGALAGGALGSVLTMGAIGGSLTTLGAIAGPLGMVAGALIGAALGSVVSKLFGTSVSVKDQGLTANATSLGQVDSGNFTAQSFAEVQKKKKAFGITYSDKTSIQTAALSSDISNQFGLIISGMGESIRTAAGILGQSGQAFNDRLNTFVVDLGLISLKGLTGAEAQAKLEAAFSKVGDDMAKFAVGSLTEFQKVGEGAYETLVRIANDYATVDAVLASFNKSFGAVGMASVAARERLIELSGGLSEFTSQGGYFLENFFTDAEKAATLRTSVNAVLTPLNQGNAVTTIEQFKKLALSQDLTTESGAKTYASMMAVAQAFIELTRYGDEFGVVAKTSSEILSERKDLQQQLNEITMTSVQLLALEREALDASNRALFDQIQATKAVVSAKDALAKAYETEAAAGKAALEKAKSWVTTLNGLNPALQLSEQSTLTPEQKYAEARGQFEKTLAEAMAGDTTAQGKLSAAEQAFLAASQVVNANDSKYQADYDRVLAANNDALKWAKQQVDIEQASLDALKASVAGLITVNDSVLTVAQAIRDLQAANEKSAGLGVKFSAPEGSAAAAAAIGNTATSAAFEGTSYSATSAAAAESLAAEVRRLTALTQQMMEENAANAAAVAAANAAASKQNAAEVVDGVKSAAQTSIWTGNSKEIIR